MWFYFEENYFLFWWIAMNHKSNPIAALEWISICHYSPQMHHHHRHPWTGWAKTHSPHETQASYESPENMDMISLYKACPFRHISYTLNFVRFLAYLSYLSLSMVYKRDAGVSSSVKHKHQAITIKELNWNVEKTGLWTKVRGLLSYFWQDGWSSKVLEPRMPVN